ncbi:MAG: phosphatidylglycerophosphatase A [Deltaproteobacteria bacterium]|nr:phosphatidylglycerophosphatase A [Deltaproteobacteria bacterium]
MTRAPLRVVASGFGAGFAPVAPGTAGTLVGIPVALALGLLPPWLRFGALVVSLPLGALACGRAAAEEGGGDPAWIVLDEVIGYCFSVAWAPRTVAAYGAAFLLFRLFDILKPPPAGWIDRVVPGGWGILLDDVCAGLYTAAALGLLALLGVT